MLKIIKTANKEKKNLIDPFVYYAREIHIDDAADRHRISKIVIGVVDDSVIATNPDGTNPHQLTNPAIIGNEEYACGLFIPFGASIDTIEFAANCFTDIYNKNSNYLSDEEDDNYFYLK